MIWVESVRPIKEKKYFRSIYVRRYAVEKIKKTLANANLKIINNDFYQGRYRLTVRATDSEWNRFTEQVELIEIYKRRYCKEYILKEELS